MDPKPGREAMLDLVPEIEALPLSQRISRLRECITSDARYVSLDQALLVTESYAASGDKPRILQRALAFKAALSGLPIRIYPGELIVGNRTRGSRGGVVSPEAGITWLGREAETLETRPQDPFIFPEKEKRLFRERIVPAWRGKTLEDRIRAEVGEELSAISRVVKINQTDHAQGHILPDLRSWLSLGIGGLRKKVEKAAQEGSRQELYSAMLVCLDGAAMFFRRYADEARRLASEGDESEAARRAELREIARVCEKLADEPPSGFHEALQSVWFLFVLVEIESNASSFSLGRIDQILFPFFKRDIESGLIGLGQALELLESFWLNFTKIVYMRNANSARYFAGFPIGFNAVIGGRTLDGKDASNALSYLCLKAQEHVRQAQPNLGARLHAGSPDEFLDACSRVIGLGGGMPQVFGDESIIPTLEGHGVSHEDAADYAVVGCVELSPQGNCLGWSDAAMFNLVKALELALNNGKCLLTGEQLGPDLGSLEDYDTFEKLEEAFKGQVDHFMERMVRLCDYVDRMHASILPSPFLSLVVNDCIEKGRDVTEGGAKYNFSGIQAIQPANLADCLAALKLLVYEERRVDRAELLAALRSDFKGDEPLRQTLLNRAPKYGNDIEWVDQLGLQWISYFKERLSRSTNARGGAYHIGLYTVSAHVPLGMNVGATPDGRHARAPLADGGISAVYGRDTRGPTALLKSVARMSAVQAGNGTLLNMKFQPDFFKEESRGTFVQLLKGFVRLKIHHAQFNVVRKEDLEAARRDPESWRGFTVRVAGYTAYFTDLASDLQDEIIARTAYGDQ
ncbi:MAG: formate C-acetyltransferase/glycerol dehydratase family glycyl radical enzyme [Spirochaetia bacterium]|jgi:formate C-acetyltransferase